MTHQSSLHQQSFSANFGLHLSKMGILAVALVVFSLIRIAPVYAQEATPTGNPVKTAVQRLVVGLTDCGDASIFAQTAAALGGQLISANQAICTLVIQVDSTQSRNAVAVEQVSNLHFVEADGRVQGMFTPNDPFYNNPTQVYAPTMMNAEAAWDFTLGDSTLIVAVIDTGIDPNHEEFAGRILPGYDYVNEDSDPTDDHGHGTHVAGILAAGIDNGVGVAGMAGRVQILPMKVLAANNSGWWSDVALAMVDAVDQGARVINLSLAGTSSSTALQQAIAYATLHKTLVVVAAGNDGSNVPVYPAAYPDVLSVGALDYNGNRWSYSNYGPNVDVMAPGQMIYSAYWQSGMANSYAYMTGTSMAAPHVAGVAALLFSVNPDLTTAQAMQALTETAVDKGDPGADAFYGYGLVDAGAAVMAVAPVQEPTGLIGDQIWWDQNGNQQVDAGEPGIPQVPVQLLDGTNQLVQTTTTDSAGVYTFTHLSPGSYQVVIAAATFMTNGLLANWQLSGMIDGQEVGNTIGGQSAAVEVTVGQERTDVDFGFNIASAYTLSHQRVGPAAVRPSELVQFSIHITNTGNTWLDPNLLVYTYDPTYLSFDHALPASADSIDDGSLNWSSLQIGLIAPGEALQLTAAFRAKGDTTLLASSQTVAAIQITPQGDPDGAGVLTAVTLAPQTAQDAVQVLNPTAVTLRSSTVLQTGDQVQIRWETVSEAQVVGFNLLRRQDGADTVQINDQLLLTQQAGSGLGGVYTVQDSPKAGSRYTYLLEIVHVDGSITTQEVGVLTVLFAVYLPVVTG